MPPLPSVEIPVIVRSGVKGKDAVGRAPKPRTYNDEPLPVAPSNHAPRNAKIIGRVIEMSGVYYTLKIGEVEIDDVTVEEILEYVSPLELEEFENQQFVEEGIAQDAAEAAEVARRQEQLERMKQRAKTNGAVFVETDTGTGTSDDVEGSEEVQGRHGRARPTYTHLFKQIKDRKGKTIVRSMDGPDFMSDEEDEAVFKSEPTTRAPVVRGPVSFTELPKRRRRKRDKATGELLPLSSVAQAAASAEKRKRQRRRRHPLTGELMPVGWRYDPSNQNDTYESRRSGTSSVDRKPSLSQEHTAKRPRLDTPSEWSRSASPVPPKPAAVVQAFPSSTFRPFNLGNRAGSNAAVVDLLTSEDEPEATPRKGGSGSQQSPPKPASPRSTNNMMRSMALSSAPETSPEPVLRPFRPAPSPSKTTPTLSPVAPKTASPSCSKGAKTSILNPSAGRASSTEPPMHPDEEEASDEELEDEEFFIEGVLAHSWSDPRTHPAALGDEPVMLYQVKWQGYKDPTWEPVESFTDRSVLHEYRRRVGLPAEASDEDMDSEEEQAETTISPKKQKSKHSDADINEDQESLDEDEYEVEAIVGHHLSDPRTHPPDLGKKPVMLYHVKWKGYEELTWEPASSFEDTALIQSYNEHYGVKDATMQSDADEEMGGSL